MGRSTLDRIPAGLVPDGARAAHHRRGKDRGLIFANSRDVAAFFGKRHDAVLRDIGNLLGYEADLGLHNFVEGSYKLPSTGAQQHRCFDMDRDGFALLASVDKLLSQDPELRLHDFMQTFVVVDMPNGGTREDRAFDLTRDGFALLAMGFTGQRCKFAPLSTGRPWRARPSARLLPRRPEKL